MAEESSSQPVRFPKVAENGGPFPSAELRQAIEYLKLFRFHDANNILQRLAVNEKSSPNNIFAALFLGVNYLSGHGLPVHKDTAMAYLDKFKDYIAPFIENCEKEQDRFLAYCLGYLRFTDSSFKTSKTAADYFQLAADLGDDNARAMLGLCYEQDSHGVKKDIKRSRELYKEEAKKGSVLAKNSLASLFLQDQPTQATVLFMDAEKLGSIYAKTFLAKHTGDLAKQGLGDPRTLVTAASQLEEARAQKFGYAISLLADYYNHGIFKKIEPILRKGLPQWLFEDDRSLVFSLYEEAVECGYSVANLTLGQLWCKNLEKLPGAKPASTYFRKAADQGFAEGYYNLACCYYDGSGGVKVNEVLFYKYLVQAARMGFEQARKRFSLTTDMNFSAEHHNDLWLGRLVYNKGKLYEENDWAAEIIICAFEEASKLGYEAANLELGRWYLKIAKDSEAIACFKAIIDSTPAAIVELGMYYLDKNPEEAVVWFQQGADRDDAAAQLQLGSCFETGKGTAANLKDAIYWYSMAASQGNTAAAASFKRLLRFDYASYEKIVGRPKKRAMEVRILLDSKISGPSVRAEASLDPSSAPAVRGSAPPASVSAEDAKVLRSYHHPVEPKNADALFESGIDCRNGRGREVDRVEAIGYFIQAAIEGHRGAQRMLEMEPEVGPWHKPALGDPDAQFMVAEGYRWGKSGLKQNLNLAINWYSKAAEQGNISAKKALEAMPFMMAEGYRWGISGLKQNINLAINWYSKAAEQGDISAEKALKALPSSEILECYEASAKEGDPLAQYRLARCYDLGLYGITPNSARAEFWYRQSATKEHSHAEAARQAAASYKHEYLWFEQATFPGESGGVARKVVDFREKKGEALEKAGEETRVESRCPSPTFWSRQGREMVDFSGRPRESESPPSPSPSPLS